MSEEKSHTECVEIFFDDLDAFGMLYHGRYAAILERGLTTYYAKVGLTFGHEDTNLLVRELSITYDQSIVGMGLVDLTFWLEKLGNSSAVLAFRFHSGDTVHAHGRRVVIKIDPRTMKPAAWSESTRSFLTEDLLVEG
jgi:acyl-CoA thioester hydrolase